MFSLKIRQHIQKRLVKLVYDIPEKPLENKILSFPQNRGDFNPYEMFERDYSNLLVFKFNFHGKNI